ncbi:MAG: hypothetical protein JWQ71_3845 [Pedosphaera sp.]|nr:hypothetical protein [Pedosphaera sp.]
MAANVQGGPILNNTTPLSFFTNCADHLLRSQLNLSVTNIPVYDGTNLVYSPAVHRLLQLSANIYDASTNRPFVAGSTNFYPSVFRPRFGVNNKNIFINGFVEETNNVTSYLVPPLSLPEDADVIVKKPNLVTNIYGVPWIIGAKKGLPNFNEFAMQTVSQVTRKLQISRPPNTPNDRNTWVTNQMYVVGISNIMGVELWNSYSSNYSRAIDVVLFDDLTMTLTNDTGLVLTTNVPMAPVPFTIPATGPNQWQGFLNTQNPNKDRLSFRAPLYTNVVLLPDSVYRQNPQGFVVSTNFEQNTGFPLPNFVLGVTNRLRVILLDHDTGRVIDYVHFNGLDEVREITRDLSKDDGVAGVWRTNRVGNPFTGPLEGIINQMQVSMGAITISLSDWNNAQLQQSTLQSKQLQISNFINLFNNPSANPNLLIQAPFSPTRKYSRTRSWQANDPLVHYTLGDLSILQNTNQLISVVPPNGLSNVLANIGVANQYYAPWGGNPKQSADPNKYNLALKDPLVSNSDDWNFPDGAALDFSWLGRVHRGTPWQTLYFKSASVDSAAWQLWTGNANPADAQHTQPANDWHIASLLISLLNTNPPASLFSINQTNLSLAFGIGINVLTNTTDDGSLNNYPPPTLQFDSLLMDSNAPQAAVIVSAINLIRSSQPGQYFHDISDILATPELSINSPWLNLSDVQQQYGITDVAYEIIPSQFLPLLRLDSIGSIAPANGSLQFQFTGFDGYAYSIETSPNLQTWIPVSTKYPTNGTFSFTDSATNSAIRYYRSVMLP